MVRLLKRRGKRGDQLRMQPNYGRHGNSRLGAEQPPQSGFARKHFERRTDGSCNPRLPIDR
jgi:hypothetical protein